MPSCGARSLTGTTLQRRCRYCHCLIFRPNNMTYIPNILAFRSTWTVNWRRIPHCFCRSVSTKGRKFWWRSSLWNQMRCVKRPRKNTEGDVNCCGRRWTYSRCVFWSLSVVMLTTGSTTSNTSLMDTTSSTTPTRDLSRRTYAVHHRSVQKIPVVSVNTWD